MAAFLSWGALFGCAIGFLAALTGAPQRIIAGVIDLPNAQNKLAIAAVVAALVLVYLLCILLPLAWIAREERATWDVIDPSIRTTFNGNLRRRGSFGHLAFLSLEQQRVLER